MHGAHALVASWYLHGGFGREVLVFELQQGWQGRRVKCLEEQAEGGGKPLTGSITARPQAPNEASHSVGLWQVVVLLADNSCTP